MSSWCARLAAFWLGLGLSQTLACGDEEVTLFACQTTNENRAIYLCGTPDGANGWFGIRYVYATKKGEELSYPADPAQGREKLFFSHLFRKGLYEMYVRFENGGYAYRLFFRDAPQSTDPDFVNGPDAGVEVIRKHKTVATINCGERPTNYFDDIRKATACDLDNPLGKAGCAENAPEEK